MWTVDSDCGVGIIRFGAQKLFPLPPEYDYQFFVDHRNEMMNVNFEQRLFQEVCQNILKTKKPTRHRRVGFF